MRKSFRLILRSIVKLLIWHKRFQSRLSPQMNLVWGFFLYTFIGFLILSIPFLHKSNISWIDNLFISTSAVSTTGLASVDISSSYNFFGQLVITVLIQIGAIGYMTLTTYYLLFTSKAITPWHNKILGAEFTLPNTIRIKDFLRSVVIFTMIMEILGSIGFFIVFSQKTNMGFFELIWHSVFHSISSFCTAGFGLYSNSFENYAGDTWINTIISVLAISGSLGFIVITDLWYRISGRSQQLSFTTQIITYGFAILLALGTFLIYILEPSIEDSPSRLMESFFQAMSAMTTVGFNTIPIGSLCLPVLLLLTFLMYIGASPSGTAGGLKITTLTAMISVIKSRLFGQRKITFFNRIIPFERIYVATSTFILYTSTIFLFTFLLTIIEDFEFDQILFEVASALGTAGLSEGVTAQLSVLGKIMIIILMFLGRVGVLTFGFALLQRRTNIEEKPFPEDLAV